MIRKARERGVELQSANLAEDGAHQPFDQFDDIFPVHKGHLHIQLGELGLAVGPQVLVPEAPDHLIVPVESGDH